MLPSDPCPIPFARSLAALRGEIDALTPLVDELTPAALQLETRLPEWNVQVLLAHLVRGVDRIAAYLGTTLPDEPELTWIGYVQSAAPSGSGGDISERARAFADRLNARPIRQVWRELTDDARRLAELAPPERLVATPFGALRLDHYLPSRVMEVTVHGLDLRHALGFEEVATPGALLVTSRYLEDLLDDVRPDDLADEVSWLLAATGRVDHVDPRLPVVS